MPRLTTQLYLDSHRVLRDVWLTSPEAFSLIPSKQQGHLHDFFVPAKDLTRQQLLAHRKTVAAQQPNLPHQAGRALRELLNVATGKQPSRAMTTSGPGSQGSKRIRVRSARRPEIDVDKLAMAIWMMAMEESAARRPIKVFSAHKCHSRDAQ